MDTVPQYITQTPDYGSAASYIYGCGNMELPTTSRTGECWNLTYAQIVEFNGYTTVATAKGVQNAPGVCLGYGACSLSRCRGGARPRGRAAGRCYAHTAEPGIPGEGRQQPFTLFYFFCLLRRGTHCRCGTPPIHGMGLGA